MLYPIIAQYHIELNRACGLIHRLTAMSRIKSRTTVAIHAGVKLVPGNFNICFGV